MTTGDKSILYNSCAIQVFFAFLLGASEFYLLAAMSYDRYVAICKPLHYMTIMNKKVCVQLVLSCWLAGFLVIFPPLLLGLNLDFCASNIVDHFYCDTTPLMQLSCRHTALGDDGLCLGFGDTLSHMIVISLSYGSCIFMYVKPSVKQRVSISKGISVLNTSVAPLLNPFIYTLRNQQVKRAFVNTIHRIASFSKK
ncbi:Olfactory receptor 6C74 [Lemmus lemmus]